MESANRMMVPRVIA